MANPETVDVVPEPRYYTADEVRALNDAGPTWWPRYECVYGELLVTPSPGTPHQEAAQQLFLRLNAYIEAQRIDLRAYMSPADISWGRRDVTAQPDVFVVPRTMARSAFRERSWSLIGHLVLASEVLSPSSVWADRFRKRKLYQDRGVPLYWILDPESRTAEVWTPAADYPTIERERLVWHPEGATEPLVIPLAELFAEP